MSQGGLLEITTSFLGDVTGILVTAILSRKVGRTLQLRTWAFYGVLTALPFFYKLSISVEYITLLSFKFLLSGFWYLLRLITVEAFPTAVRGAATSFISAMGDVGGIGANVLVYILYSTDTTLVWSLFVAATVVKLLGTLFWRQDTKNSNMEDY